jgi:hypothetical protein
MGVSPIAWTQDSIADAPLRRYTGRVGAIEVAVEWDGSNRLWTWSTRLADDAWDHSQSEHGAKQGFEAWLRGWLENFRPFFQ